MSILQKTLLVFSLTFTFSIGLFAQMSIEMEAPKSDSLDTATNEIIAPTKDKPLSDVLYQMPVYQPFFCEDESLEVQKQCSDRAMLTAIYNHITYPQKAVEKGIEGTVVISFVVTKEGKAIDHQIIRNVGAGCGEEALRVVKEHLLNWGPGLNLNKQAVNVQFNLPIQFRFETGKDRRKRKKAKG